MSLHAGDRLLWASRHGHSHGFPSLRSPRQVTSEGENSMSSRSLRPHRGLVFSLLFILVSINAFSNRISGRILDPTGAGIPNAKVIVASESKNAADTISDTQGHFGFESLPAGRYTVQASAAGFRTTRSAPLMLHESGDSTLDITLALGTIAQQIVVTATGTETPESQVGASVNVIGTAELQGRPDVFDALRIAPGIQGIQTGGQGGKASLFVRGGNSDSNKVLIDGIPANDIGGTYEFANLSSGDIGSIELFRGPNSVLFGSDAIASVVNVTTRRGTTTTPQLTLSGDGGTFNVYDYSADLSGAYRAFDYLSDFSRANSHNNIPNDEYHNITFAGNYGWSPLAATDLRLTVRRNVSNVGQPNAFDLFKIADDSFLKEQNTFIGTTLQNQTTSRWHNLVRYGAARLSLQSVNPTPTGIPFDPFGFGPNYLGQTVTLCAPGGCALPGQAILDFGGTYPSKFDSFTKRDFVQTQSDYRFNSHFTTLFGFRYENERGVTNSAFANDSTSRNNFSYTIQGQSSFFNRLYATAGVGLEKNAIFGFAATPRVSLAYYLAPPRSAVVSGTKLRFNFGKGIKEPSIFDETSSLFSVLNQSSPQLISQFHVSPAGPERSQSFDFGFEQSLFEGRAQFSATLFHNRYYDQFEFVDKTLLPQIGVPTSVANTLTFGAAVNSLDYRARGAETELAFDLGNGFAVKATYTYTGAVVTKSFSSDNEFPSFNPAFPTIPIGAFSPLVGNRPFRIAPHTGTFGLSYAKQKFFASMTGYLSSRRDDSTFLTDSFFGSSLLLPNRNLADSYQKVDLYASYAVHPAVKIFTSAENILNQHYEAAYGFPSLPFTIRAGLKLTIGGEGWKLKP